MRVTPRWLVAHTWGTIRARPLFPAGHFYSPVPSDDDVLRAATWLDRQPAEIDLHRDAQAALVSDVGPSWSRLERQGRWAPSDQLSLGDAAVYASLLSHWRPDLVVEVGSGYTTAVALDAIEEYHLSTELVCVEPYPDRLRALLRTDDPVHLYEVPVQDLDPAVFARLTAGDLLFIDSTHVAKSGSDVVWLMLHILPTLAPGVIVHFHDIFWPFEYPAEWLAQRRGWNEIYLLRALLTGSTTWQIELFNDYVWATMKNAVERWLPEATGERPGSIWLRKT